DVAGGDPRAAGRHDRADRRLAQRLVDRRDDRDLVLAHDRVLRELVPRGSEELAQERAALVVSLRAGVAEGERGDGDRGVGHAPTLPRLGLEAKGSDVAEGPGAWTIPTFRGTDVATGQRSGRRHESTKFPEGGPAWRRAPRRLRRGALAVARPAPRR